MPDTPTPGAEEVLRDADLWDDVYANREDGRWLAALQGTFGLYEATWEALSAAIAQGDTPTAAAHVDRLHGLIRRTEEPPHA